MATWKDVTAIALSLPRTEVSTWYGTPGVKVAGKGFLRLRSEAEGGVVVMCDPRKKAMLLDSGNPAFYTTPHYDGYPSILVNLNLIARAELVDLVTESWRRKAPLPLLKAFDAAAQSSPPPRRGKSATGARKKDIELTARRR
jgi:hypothetical protein